MIGTAFFIRSINVLPGEAIKYVSSSSMYGKLWLTQLHRLFPVPILEMDVEHIPLRTRPRDVCAVGQVICVCPAALRSFTVGSPHTRGQIEGKHDIAGLNVGGKVELRDQEHDMVLLGLKLERLIEFLHSLP
jgi:hypothetical protein